MQADYGRVLYEGRSQRSGVMICVTTRWCIVNGIRYPMEELYQVGLSRGRRDLLDRRTSTWLAAVVFTLVAVVAAIGSGWTRKISIALAVTAVATLAITVLPSALSSFLRRPFQIWAEYQGAPVLLFDTHDAEQYGQVARALVRARENNFG